MPSTKEIYDTITPKGAKKKFVILAIIAILLLAIILFYLFLHDSKNITYTTIKPIKGIQNTTFSYAMIKHIPILRLISMTATLDLASQGVL